MLLVATLLLTHVYREDRIESGFRSRQLVRPEYPKTRRPEETKFGNGQRFASWPAALNGRRGSSDARRA